MNINVNRQFILLDFELIDDPKFLEFVSASEFGTYLLKIDTLCLEGIYSQRLIGFSQPISGSKNRPQVEQNIVPFGLN
jgi:hypothetical protein